MNFLLVWENPPPLKLIVFSRQAARTASPGRFCYGRHKHAFYELGIVLAGVCDWQIRHRRLRLRKGQAVLIKPGTLHGEEALCKLKSELAWVGFEFAGPAPTWSERAVSLGSDMDEIATSFHAIYREHSSDDPLTSKRVSLALQNLLVLVSRRAASAGRRQAIPSRAQSASCLNARQIRSLESAAHYFRHNIQAPLSIAQVAAYHSFSPAYFSTLFRQHFGVPPRTHLRHIKLEKGSELLTTSDLSIKEISARCGFVDAAHFTKAFKQKHRLTPGAYRLKANDLPDL